MRVARLELTGVGPFEGALFEMPEPTRGTGELVLFEGPNGSGKTTLVQTLAVLLSGFWKRTDVKLEDAAKNMGDLPWLSTTPPVHGFLRRRHGSAAAVRVDLVDGTSSMDVRVRARPVRNGDDGIVWSDDSGWNPVLAKLDRFGSWVEYGDTPVEWAAFAYQAHQPSAELATAGPRDIEVAPLSGALSFGEHLPESGFLGQLLANLENERTKALAYANEKADDARKLDLARTAGSRREAIRRFESVLTKVLGRDTTIEFSVDQQAPTILLDGEAIPLDLLGEGLRSTMAWVSDLLVRLERIRWADRVRSPIDQDFWLILDEIDESLHPNMQARIYPALRELFPNARIYATTHSPFAVASVGEGVVFPIRPDRDHKVRGRVEARPLRPGESLELVTDDIFQARYGFVDQPTRDDLDAHDRDVRNLERKKEIDWNAFMARRDRLMQLNDEVRTVVAMQEVRVQKEVLARLRERVAESEREARS
jgi:energy-coupling factor transporter ATP-binding protein EcfA2